MNKSFDKILSFEVDDASVDYGFVFGDSQKILFIKAGAHGSMNGYHDKYLSIALNAREKYGITVVCGSNPECGINQATHAMQVLETVIENFDQAEIYFMGFSKGASQGCMDWTKITQVKRLLLINPPLMINTPKLCAATKRFAGEKMTFVFGSEDPSIGTVDLFKLYERENVKVEVVPGQDHFFSKNGFNLFELAERELFYDHRCQKESG